MYFEYFHFCIEFLFNFYIEHESYIDPEFILNVGKLPHSMKGAAFHVFLHLGNKALNPHL